MRIAGMLPFRLLDIAKQEFPALSFPSPNVSKLQNARLIDKADYVIGFYDGTFFQEGRSIGTKLEMLQYENKTLGYYFWSGDGWIPTERPPICEKLPTYKQYISD